MKLQSNLGVEVVVQLLVQVDSGQVGWIKEINAKLNSVEFNVIHSQSKRHCLQSHLQTEVGVEVEEKLGKNKLEV